MDLCGTIGCFGSSEVEIRLDLVPTHRTLAMSGDDDPMASDLSHLNIGILTAAHLKAQ